MGERACAGMRGTNAPSAASGRQCNVVTCERGEVTGVAACEEEQWQCFELDPGVRTHEKEHHI